MLNTKKKTKKKTASYFPLDDASQLLWCKKLLFYFEVVSSWLWIWLLVVLKTKSNFKKDEEDLSAIHMGLDLYNNFIAQIYNYCTFLL